MKKRPNRLLAVVAVCAVAGALAGIAGSAAAPSKSKTSASAAKAKAAAKAKRARGDHFRRLGPGPLGFRMGAGGPPVHSESVVPNADGTGFDTVTTDSGTLDAIDGSKLTVKEGTEKATYKTVTVDVGDDAKVIRNHEDAKLSDLKEGDNVHVIQAPKGNVVIAETDAFRAQERKEHGRFHRRGALGPPPPGAPPAPPGASGTGA